MPHRLHPKDDTTTEAHRWSSSDPSITASHWNNETHHNAWFLEIRIALSPKTDSLLDMTLAQLEAKFGKRHQDHGDLYWDMHGLKMSVVMDGDSVIRIVYTSKDPIPAATIKQLLAESVPGITWINTDNEQGVSPPSSPFAIHSWRSKGMALFFAAEDVRDGSYILTVEGD
jgi:hypothetical protein